MKKPINILFLTFCFQITISQTTILQCLKLQDSLFDKHVYGDISPTRTTIDIKNGYYEASTFESDKKGKVTKHLTLFQATIFINKDTTITLATTAYKADEQCDWHETNFYEISKNRDSIKKINTARILPEVMLESTLVSVKAKMLIKKYCQQPQINYHQTKLISNLQLLSSNNQTTEFVRNSRYRNHRRQCCEQRHYRDCHTCA